MSGCDAPTDAVLGMEYNAAEGHEDDTVASIVAEMRDTWTDTPPSILSDLADRIEAAVERERVGFRVVILRAKEILAQVSNRAEIPDFMRAWVDGVIVDADAALKEGGAK
jgi:hypothetical protein